jgi:hypothetical protein
MVRATAIAPNRLGRALTQEPSDYIEGAFFEDATSGNAPWDQRHAVPRVEPGALRRRAGITTWAGLPGWPCHAAVAPAAGRPLVAR